MMMCAVSKKVEVLKLVDLYGMAHQDDLTFENLEHERKNVLRVVFAKV